MASDRLLRRLPRRIAGASAVEFALIFPIVFAIVYGGIVYGYLYFLQQRINFFAQEGVRAAIAVAPSDDGDAYEALLQAQGEFAINQSFQLAGLTRPAALTATFVLLPAVAGGSGATLQGTVRYDLSSPVLFPTVTLPLVGSIPPLPTALVATAAGRLS